MISTAMRRHLLLIATIATAATVLATSPAQAQWGGGYGGGMGLGFFGFGANVEQPGTFLNSVALAQMNHVRGPIHNNVYAGNPNSYLNHVRDNGFVDRYYPDHRDPAYYGYASRPRPRQVATTPTSAPSRPGIPLTSFYNDKGQLLWPSDAPLSGDLKAKRQTVDKACTAALDELKKNGVASIASVTEARQKLLDYGRPALTLVKQKETPPVADGFHAFLLTLYNALAEAAHVAPSGS